MCRQHLLGEHKEMHQALGSLRRGRSVQGHVDKGQLDVRFLQERHDELVHEMTRRGYNHRSPLCMDVPIPQFYMYENSNIDVERNKQELSVRCARCRKRMEKEDE
jgi:hypothetical protein